MNPASSIEPRAARSTATKTELRVIASKIVNEYLATQSSDPSGELGAEARTELLEQLLARCPGFSTRDYRTALTAAFAGRIRLVPSPQAEPAVQPLLDPSRRPRPRR